MPYMVGQGALNRCFDKAGCAKTQRPQSLSRGIWTSMPLLLASPLLTFRFVRAYHATATPLKCIS
jgi:hypothetical protein